MIPIKIQCECGQKYAFEIEPVNGQMPSTIACPTCGADGTSTANSIIAQHLTSSSPPVRVAVPSAQPAPTRPAPRRLPGQPDPQQAIHEARAKMLWGDTQQEVLSYLMIQGFSRQEASDHVKALHKERIATVRATGMRKILTGVGCICVPIVALIIFLSIGYIPIKIFAATVAVGLFGAYMVITGMLKVLSPKMEQGDASH